MTSLPKILKIYYFQYQYAHFAIFGARSGRALTVSPYAYNSKLSYTTPLCSLQKCVKVSCHLPWLRISSGGATQESDSTKVNQCCLQVGFYS